MFSSENFTMRGMAGILIIFALWCGLSVAWYVCGVNQMCNISASAQENVSVQTTETGEFVLTKTQVPAIMAYDRSGAAGQIFVMLMIAFTLGALLGRILAAPREEESSSAMRLPVETEKIQIPERVRSPVHISEFTRNMPRAPIPNPQPIQAKPLITPPPKPISAPIILPSPTPAPTIAAKTPERPKVRFNTSWSNPNRDQKKA
jgi:hypothetical protein